MRVRIEIDAGERQAEFIREPRLATLSDRPSALLVDELVGAEVIREVTAALPGLMDWTRPIGEQITAALYEYWKLGSTDTRAWLLHGNVCENCRPRVEQMHAQVITGVMPGTRPVPGSPEPAGGGDDG